MPSANVLRLAVVGVGKVGRNCAEAMCRTDDLVPAALVRRTADAGDRLPDAIRHVPVVVDIGQARDVQGALVCVPTNFASEAARRILSRGIPTVECATYHGEALLEHKATLHKAARQHKVPVIVGAGWDPGLLSLFRSWFALLTPGGTTETKHRPGTSLHHTLMARSVAGVKDALSTEVRAADGRLQRYVYVELERGASPEQVAAAIRADPLFLNEETQVFPVESLAGLEREGRGVVLERQGPSGPLAHQGLLFEARFEEALLTAQVMLAAARALPTLGPGAHLLSEIPLAALWGDRAEKAAREWL